MQSNLLLRLGTAVLLLIPTAIEVQAQNDEKHPLAEMPLRSIGPAVTSGRVSDFAFHPTHREIYYVAMASGGLWKTVNNGTTWTPIFDKEGAYALGVVALDPKNPNIVWVGSGENNSQRSVGYGDGVYKSLDGGNTWTNVGLKNSEHISMIRFHPDDSDVVWVASQGPLWNSGGDRGLYRTDDGGKTWNRILHIDEDTGVNEFVIHPDDPDVIVASSYQRRRHVWTLINGGPGGGIHKTMDGGATWRKIEGKLPKGDVGRIGLAAAPSSPNVLYAIIEAEKDQGVYRSTDFGETWEKRSDRMTSSPQYYNELFVDPLDPERVYSIDTFTHVSEDGGKTWRQLSIKYRHVDDHAMWIDPENTAHFFIGGDGGVYETWDRGETWLHIQNLPVTQFYRSTPDNDFPFYNVCAGTQDNHTLCGPSRTRFTDGITNADWWIALSGDGFKAQIDPTDANIVYAQYQNGGLRRVDRITGERLAITPRPGSGENDYKWNWNSPLIISPHDHRRLYYGAERLFRSDDRGESWVAVSGDLTRQLDRNKLEVMGRIWSVDAVAKNASTSMYGSLIALDESPLQEDLLYVGTDDGLIHVTEDGGQTWRRQETFGNVPSMSLVEDIIASRHDPNVAYAAFDNHKRGDFKPYVLMTSDKGRTWRSIAGNLPARGTAHTLVQDHVDPNLLFAGTEFGVFFTNDAGAKWHELTSLPTIAVRDIEIQRRETDLVVGTFGRGVYILDDYSALRSGGFDADAEANLFAVRDAWLFVPDVRRGWGGLGDNGWSKYSADNPKHGAVFSYHLASELKTLQETRRDAEKEVAKEGGDNPYPTWDELRREDREEKPSIVLTVMDSDGNVVRRLDGPVKKGFHRVAWDLRYPAPDPIDLNATSSPAPWITPPHGPLAVPGTYTVTLSKRVEGQLTQLAEPQTFTVKPLFEGGLVAEDRESVLAFQQRTAELRRSVLGANKTVAEITARLNHLKAAVDATPSAGEDHATAVRTLEARVADLKVSLNGDQTISGRYEPVPMSIVSRVNDLVGTQWETQQDITQTYRRSLEVASEEFAVARDELEAITEDLVEIEETLEAVGAPWTPGRD